MTLNALFLAAAIATSPQHATPQPSPTIAASPSIEGTTTPSHLQKEGEISIAAGSTGEAHEAGEEGHGGAAQVLMHHVTDQAEYHPFGLPLLFPGKHLFFLLLVMAVVIATARIAIASYKDGAPHGIGSAIESLVVFVRDEIAEKNIGHGEGAKYTPLLLSFFFFILFAALFGLLPFSATSTGNLSVTLALASISFVAQQYAGISKYGVVGHFKNLVPHGLPAPLLVVMIPIEVLGVFTKPFALMIRLFANMLAGHMMIAALLMLVPLCYPISAALGIIMIPISLGMALFIMCLEVLVAFIQAYVFTLFSAMFIGMYAHPSH